MSLPCSSLVSSSAKVSTGLQQTKYSPSLLHFAIGDRRDSASGTIGQLAANEVNLMCFQAASIYAIKIIWRNAFRKITMLGRHMWSIIHLPVGTFRRTRWYQQPQALNMLLNYQIWGEPYFGTPLRKGVRCAV